MLARRRPAPAVPAPAPARPLPLRRWAALSGVALPLLLAAPAPAADPAADPAAGVRQQVQAQLDAARQQAQAQLDAARQQAAGATAGATALPGSPGGPAPESGRPTDGAISVPVPSPVGVLPSAPAASATATRTAASPAVPAEPVPSASEPGSPQPSGSAPAVASASASAEAPPSASVPVAPGGSPEPSPSAAPEPGPEPPGPVHHQQPVVPLFPELPDPSAGDAEVPAGPPAGGQQAVPEQAVPTASAAPGTADGADPLDGGAAGALPTPAGEQPETLADGTLAVGPVAPPHWNDPSARQLPLGVGLGLMGLGFGLVGWKLRRREAGDAGPGRSTGRRR